MRLRHFRGVGIVLSAAKVRDRQVGELSVVSYCSELASGELQDLEFSESCRQDFEFSKSCRQDLEFSKSWRKILNFPNLASKILNFPNLGAIS